MIFKLFQTVHLAYHFVIYADKNNSNTKIYTIIGAIVISEYTMCIEILMFHLK